MKYTILDNLLLLLLFLTKNWETYVENINNNNISKVDYEIFNVKDIINNSL